MFCFLYICYICQAANNNHQLSLTTRSQESKSELYYTEWGIGTEPVEPSLHSTHPHSERSICSDLIWAGHVELGLAVCREHTPVLLIHGLAVVTNAVGLPRLIESFKIEDVNAPSKQTANTILVVLLCICSTSLGNRVVSTTI